MAFTQEEEDQLRSLLPNIQYKKEYDAILVKLTSVIQSKRDASAAAQDSVNSQYDTDISNLNNDLSIAKAKMDGELVKDGK